MWITALAAMIFARNEVNPAPAKPGQAVRKRTFFSAA
jgi:hypothetical protein